MIEIVTDDENTEESALRSADEVLGYCAAMAHTLSRKQAVELLALIKEGQRRIRRQTNPEMFDEQGKYK